MEEALVIECSGCLMCGGRKGGRENNREIIRDFMVVRAKKWVQK